MRNEEDQRYGRNKATVINHAYIESGEYRRKFDAITESAEVNRVLYEKAKEMLNHRSGTLFEDMYWIDGDTGKVIDCVLHETMESGVRYRKGTLAKLKQHQRIVALHTHPHSMPPSISDFNMMYQNGYAVGLVLCHDGKIFSYSAQEPVSEDLYDLYIATAMQMGYTGYEGQIFALDKLKQGHAMQCEEVRPNEER